ncbi:hypothetical protein BDW22DRAFT_1345601 [Trametopsis cervina]|nr:hypothetical protein BDW22DRAFT_1345601 [Trametopsis cervina]
MSDNQPVNDPEVSAFVVGDNLLEENQHFRIFKIQNASTKLFATYPSSPPFGNGLGPIWIVANKPTPNPTQKWLIIGAGRDVHGHPLYMIRNVGKGFYAWSPEVPKKDQPVYAEELEKLWKITHQRDGHFTISPAPIGEQRFFWSQDDNNVVVLDPKVPDPVAEETRHWRLGALRGF